MTPPFCASAERQKAFSLLVVETLATIELMRTEARGLQLLGQVKSADRLEARANRLETRLRVYEAARDHWSLSA